MQFPLGIPTDLRANFDYIFLLADDFVNNQKRLYEHYAGMFPTLDSFKGIFNKLTQNYRCMVIANGTGGSSQIGDKVFWYKAQNAKIGQMGCKQFVEYHRCNYDPKWDKKAFVDADINQMFKKKGGVVDKIRFEQPVGAQQKYYRDGEDTD